VGLPSAHHSSRELDTALPQGEPDTTPIREAVKGRSLRFVPTKSQQQQSGSVTSQPGAIRRQSAELGVALATGRNGMAELPRDYSEDTHRVLAAARFSFDVLRCCLCVAEAASQLQPAEEVQPRFRAKNRYQIVFMPTGDKCRTAPRSQAYNLSFENDALGRV
jgi:hypothetical protein